MALDEVRLDDLQWQSMTTAIRGRIAPASDGLWTLHALVDPGVTLLELYAWLLEQRVFWMDQVPDSFVLAAMGLLGESPRPVRLAGTVIHVSAGPPVVPAMTKIRRDRPGSGVVFTTTHGLTRLRVSRVGLEVGGVNHSENLASGRRIELFADGAAEVRIVLWLDQPPPAAPVAEPLTLLFDLDVPGRSRLDPDDPGVAPEWSPVAVAEVPPPADLQWLHPSTAGGLAGFPASAITDGTAGLRRPGVVRLPVPGDWAADGPADPATLATPYSIVLRASNATWSSPPRLAALAVNVALAAHRRLTKRHELSVGGWLPLPRNHVILADLRTQTFEVDHPPIAESVQVRLLERGNGWQDWTPVADLAFSSPADRVFVVDRLTGIAQFGDGLTGRVPVPDPGAPRLLVQFEVGGGEAGNLGRDLDWRGDDDPTVRARNVVAAEGGAEPESVEAARARMGATLLRVERAITRADHESIALSTPGIAIVRARAAAGVHPCFPCDVVPGALTVYVVPAVPRPTDGNVEEEEEVSYVPAPQPDAGALRLLRERFDRARLVASEVFVLGPRYRAVALRVELNADLRDPRELETLLGRRMRAYLDPLAGGDQGLGWPFGEPLRPSVLRREAQRAVGLRGEVSAVAIGLDGAPPSESCNDVSIGEHELVYLTRIDLSVRRTPTERGGLR